MNVGSAEWWRREFDGLCDTVTDLRIIVGYLLADEPLNQRQRDLLDELRRQWSPADT